MKFLAAHKVGLLLVGVALAGFLIYRARASSASAGTAGGVPVNPYSSTGPSSGGLSVQPDPSTPAFFGASNTVGTSFSDPPTAETPSAAATPAAVNNGIATGIGTYLPDPALGYDTTSFPGYSIPLQDQTQSEATAAQLGLPASSVISTGAGDGSTNVLVPLPQLLGPSVGTAPAISAPIDQARPLAGQYQLV